ncbi:MAG TPA: FAD:protein FMN transferase [Gaiellaceae bacterium]
MSAPASASFRALGTTAVLWVTDAAGLSPALDALERELDAVDRACSRFRDDSELARLNRAAGRPVPVGPVLLEAVRVALAAAGATGGLVDPTIGRSLRLAGYDRSFPVVAGRDGTAFRARFLPSPGWRQVEVDEAASTIRIPAGVELDLGATAKALAADRAAAAGAEAAGCGVHVSLGGDVAVAGEPPAEGWPVLIADDHAAPLDSPGPVVSVATGGLATSGTTVRRWRAGEAELHHILDPRSGRPASTPWRTVSVAAATCADANAASTAALVLAEAAPAWLAERRLPARLVREDGEVTCVAGWPEAA